MPQRSPPTAFLTCCSLILTACASIDAPRPVPADYAAREAAKIDPDDSCGPEFIQDNMPGWVVRATTPLFDGPFRRACERHDACYGLEEHSQSWCDDRFLEEMTAICDTGRAGALYSAPGAGKAMCRRHARAYYAAVNNTLGAYAYGDGDKVYPPGGRIADWRWREHEGASGHRELEVCVTVHNDTMVMQEYDLELRTLEGELIDREPDLHHVNVRAGERAEICLGTDGPVSWTADNLPRHLQFTLRADRPDSFAFRDVIEIVDEKTINPEW